MDAQTEEQVKSVNTESETVNSEKPIQEFDFDKKLNTAITSHLKRFEKKFFEQFKSNQPVQDSAMVNELKLQLSELQKQLDVVHQEKDAERAKARSEKKNSAINEALSEYGFVGPSNKIAKRFLDSMVDFENDDLVYNDPTVGKLSLKKGIESFLKTEEGSYLLPVKKQQQKQIHQQQVSSNNDKFLDLLGFKSKKQQ